VTKEQIWELAGSSPGRFRTDATGPGMWRDMMAQDPVDCFTLMDAEALSELTDFLETHIKHLCVGYFSYDLGLHLQGLTSRHRSQGPLAMIQAYENWQEFEPAQASPAGPRPRPAREKLRDQAAFSPGISIREYRHKIKRIQEYIRAGDFYQLNFTQQLKPQAGEIPEYPSLWRRHPAAYAMAFESDGLSIHSLSPELFLYFRDGILTTEPIKGTRPRGKTMIEDEANRSGLMASEKEQAELFMITDLLRNDLGKVCEVGSISLEAVRDLRALPRVWHTYSRISGRIRRDLKPVEALLSMLPGGSITGCPKKHAMEIIDELESQARGVYTGIMGYFHPDGDFSFNIAIRTLVRQGSELSLGSGGGITIDSDWKSEWEELLVKASTFS